MGLVTDFRVSISLDIHRARVCETRVPGSQFEGQVLRIRLKSRILAAREIAERHDSGRRAVPKQMCSVGRVCRAVCGLGRTGASARNDLEIFLRGGCRLERAEAAY